MLVSAAASGLAAAGSSSWPRPDAVRDLIVDPARFRSFAEQLSGDVERAMHEAPAPTGDTRARLLSLRVHLGLHLGRDARALAAATQIREQVTPAPERPFAGLLTEAMVVARAQAGGGPTTPGYAEALRAALGSRLATLPVSPELTAVLVRQRDRFHILSRESLLAEAQRLGARLDYAGRWTLADVDDVVRVGHRLATLLPVRDVLLAAFDAALAQRERAAAGAPPVVPPMPSSSLTPVAPTR